MGGSISSENTRTNITISKELKAQLEELAKKDKNTLAMNMKYHGRNINKFYCKKCLMKMLDINEEKWNKNIEQFKQQGCALF